MADEVDFLGRGIAGLGGKVELVTVAGEIGGVRADYGF
jgi:hypothetical protein